MKYEFDVPSGFDIHLEKAVARLSYLYPEFSFSSAERKIQVDANENLTDEQTVELKRNVFHQIYRERIFQETLPIRRWLYSDD